MRNIFINISALIILALLFSCNHQKQKNKTDNQQTKAVAQNPILDYNVIPVDSFNIKVGKIKRNQNLSDLLVKQGVTSKQIYYISQLKDVFDVRKIRSGHKYKMYLTKDSLPCLSYFVYEHSLTDYFIIQFTDTVKILSGKKETTIQKRTAVGKIESNLWNAMKDNNINPVLANELSEIYAWSIDFFGLQKGDEFFVIYDEAFINDTITVGIKHVDAAIFQHQGTDFYAFYFKQNNVGSYFDEEANSLRRAFLKAPLKYSRISSRFTRRRFHPVLKIYRPHSGVDYAAPKGTPIFSVGDGIVIKKGYQKKGAGNYLKIKHNSVYVTQYSHLFKFAKGIHKGTRLKQGDLIGYVGSTGYSTGPHLDFRFYKNGRAIDPLKVKAPPVEPISDENKEEFNKVKQSYMIELQKLYDNIK